MNQVQPAPEQVLEEVLVTVTKQARTARETVSAVGVVGADTLDRINPQIVTDALRSQPGVFVQQTTPGQGIPIVRGLKGSEVLHLVDGFRLNNAFFRNSPNQYLALVDSSDLERLEVFRGPASTLHGSDAMGGVVQLITEQPVYESGLSWQGGLTLSSADLSRLSSAGISAGSTNDAVRLHLSHSDIGARRTGSGQRLKPSGYEASAGSLNWRHMFANDSELMLDLQYLEQPSTPRIDELVAGFGETEPASTAFFFEPNRRGFWHLRYRHAPNGAWADEVLWRVGMQRIDDDRRTQNFGSSRQRNESNRSDLTGVGVTMNRTWQRQELVYGLDYYTDEVTSSRRETDLTTGQSEATMSRFPSGSRIDSSSVFAQYSRYITDRTELALGGRYSWFDIDLAQADRTFGAQLNLSDFTYNLGLRYELSDQTSLVASVGEGFRAPNIFDLGTLGNRPGNRFNIANPGLGPESVTSLDLGVKRQTARSQWEAFAFYSRFDDKITSVPTGDTTSAGRIVVQSVNAAEVRLYGVEFGGRYVLPNGLELNASLNWLRGEETDSNGLNQPADRIPSLNGVLGASWTFSDTLRSELSVLFADDQDRLSNRDIRDPRINPDGTAGWGIVNTQLDWQASPNWDIGLALQNIFDREYREHGSGIDRPGRNLILSMKGSF